MYLETPNSRALASWTSEVMSSLQPGSTHIMVNTLPSYTCLITSNMTYDEQSSHNVAEISSSPPIGMPFFGDKNGLYSIDRSEGPCIAQFRLRDLPSWQEQTRAPLMYGDVRRPTKTACGLAFNDGRAEGRAAGF